MDLTEHTLESAIAYEGSFLCLMKDAVKLPSGASASREYIRHPGAVLIAPMLDDGRLVMEKQYRYPLARAFVEFPAGKLDANEAPQSCALRELKEETGYTASELAYIGPIHNAIAYSDEVIHLYAARDLQAGAASLDEHEFVEVFTMSLTELMQAIRKGDITDVKTIIAAYALEDDARRIKPLQWQRVQP